MFPHQRAGPVLSSRRGFVRYGNVFRWNVWGLSHLSPAMFPAVENYGMVVLQLLIAKNQFQFLILREVTDEARLCCVWSWTDWLLVCSWQAGG